MLLRLTGFYHDYLSYRINFPIILSRLDVCGKQSIYLHAKEFVYSVKTHGRRDTAHARSITELVSMVELGLELINPICTHIVYAVILRWYLNISVFENSIREYAIPELFFV